MEKAMKTKQAEFDVKEKVKKIVTNFQSNKNMLIQILLKLQDNFGWLPPEAIREVSKQLEVPLLKVYNIASFYGYFSLAPEGEHTVEVCMGTACKSRGARSILEKVKSMLGIEPGETTPDLEYSLKTVNCLGCCAMGPVMVLDGKYNEHLNTHKVEKLI